MKILELFGGIGACTKALKKIGEKVDVVDYVEIDKYAVKSYNAINGTNFKPQDITEWNKNIDVDLIMHGSPCQDFSVAGKQRGGDGDSHTRSSLMWETVRIVENLRPKYVIWENVKNVLSHKHIHNFYSYIKKMNSLGYTSYYKVLNAKDYGIPQNRSRVFVVSVLYNAGIDYSFPKKIKLNKSMKDFLDKDVDDRYFLSEKMIKTIISGGTKNFYHKPEIDLNVAKPILATVYKMHRCGIDNYISEIFVNGDGKIDIESNPKTKSIKTYIQRDSYGKVYKSQNDIAYFCDGVCQTLSSSNGNGNKSNVILEDLRIRRLTPKECWRLMGFDDGDFEDAKEVNSNTQLYKQAGNSIVVDVLACVLKELLKKGENV